MYSQLFLQPALAVLFALMSTWGRMADRKALVLWFLKAPTMLAMPSSSSMDMIGRDASLKFVKTVMPEAVLWASAAVADLVACVVATAAAAAALVAAVLVAAVDLVTVAAVASKAAAAVLEVSTLLLPLLLPLTLSPITPLLEPNAARQSMSGM
jgi:hypothetical protein